VRFRFVIPANSPSRSRDYWISESAIFATSTCELKFLPIIDFVSHVKVFFPLARYRFGIQLVITIVFWSL
jgi:hypothetical protein